MQWWLYIVVLDLQAMQSVTLVHVKQSSTPQVLQVPFSFRYSLKYEKRHNINGVNWGLLPEIFSYPNPSKSWPKNIRPTVVKSNTQQFYHTFPHMVGCIPGAQCHILLHMRCRLIAMCIYCNVLHIGGMCYSQNLQKKQFQTQNPVKLLVTTTNQQLFWCPSSY